MATLGLSNLEIAEQAKAFAASIEGAEPRWLYCLSRVKQRYEGKTGVYRELAQRTIKASERVLGAGCYPSGIRYQRLEHLGFAEARAEALRRVTARDPYKVGPLESWHVGHVYFASVASHPHVLKIGFSRRVRNRLDDIESEHKVRLAVPAHHLKVGTMLDEHWWHAEWRTFNIAGEWFFDPRMTERTLPAFLQDMKAEAA